MKKINIIYWITTGLFAGLMIFTAYPDIVKVPEAMKFMTEMLGYPEYFVPFIGVVKVLGAIAILIPGFPRIKEWAYAGLAYDLIGAVYSVTAAGFAEAGSFVFFALFFILGAVSYIYHHKRLKVL